MFGLGTGEIIAILAIILLLFGAKRLPELARSLGSGIREFKKSVNDVTASATDADDTTKPKEKAE